VTRQKKPLTAPDTDPDDYIGRTMETHTQADPSRMILPSGSQSEHTFTSSEITEAAAALVPAPDVNTPPRLYRETPPGPAEYAQGRTQLVSEYWESFSKRRGVVVDCAADNDGDYLDETTGELTTRRTVTDQGDMA